MRTLRKGCVLMLVLMAGMISATTQGAESSKAKTKTSKTTQSKARKSSTQKQETSADLQRKAADMQKEISRTKSEIQANDQSIRKGVSDLKRLEADIATTTKEVDAITVQVKSLNSGIMTLEEQIAAGEARLATLRANYLSAVKKTRIARKKSSELAFLFSAKSFSEGMRRMRYIKKFRAWKERQTRMIEDQLNTLDTQRSQLSTAKQSKNQALRNQVAACSKLQTQHNEQDRIVADLRKNGQALRAHLAQKQKEANALSARVASLIAAEQAAAEQKRIAAEKAEKERQARLAAEQERKRKAAEEAERKAAREAEEARKRQQQQQTAEKPSKPTQPSKPTKPTSPAKPSKPTPPAKPAKTESPAEPAKTVETPKPVTPSAGSGFASMKGRLPRPVAGAFRITSGFGRHALPDLPDITVDNPGIDAEVSKGATAQSVYAGKVSGVYVVPGFSTVVIVNHGEYYTVYGNIASPAVSVGQSVSQGDALGTLGPDPDNPSRSTIHFEVWRNRDKQNPSAWIR